MFKRLLVFILLEIIAYNAGAQKLSNWGFEVKSFIFHDDYAISGDNWPYMFKEGYQPYWNNTLRFGTKPKGGSFPSFNSGWGLRADLVKRLFPVSGTKNNRVDLALGVGYRRYSTNRESIPDNDFRDTTTVYQLNSLNQTFTQHYADIQTRATYKLMAEDVRVGLYFGFALQLSLSLGGRIQEDLTANEATWNTASGSWKETGKLDLHQNVPAKKISYFSWGIPVGLSIKLSDKLFLLPEISYWHNTNRKYVYPDNYIGKKKSSSESGYLSIGVRYNW
jgi:opacity protein-like surface antigen